jgi:hypothetical protein
MPREKIFDYKFITIFRLLFCAMAIMAFLMPWTYSPYQNLLGGLGGFYIDRGVACSGYDYMIGCAPLEGADIFVQMPYLFLVPALLAVSMCSMFSPKRKYFNISMAVNISSFLPLFIWYLDILYRNFPNLYLTSGLKVFISMVIVNFALGLFTLRYSDIE